MQKLALFTLQDANSVILGLIIPQPVLINFRGRAIEYDVS